MNEEDRPGAVPEDVGDAEASDVEVVDELMDHVAALLKSQMRTANQHLRRRAARLLSPARVSTGTGTGIGPSLSGDGAAVGE